jgi:hypothetical protein
VSEPSISASGEYLYQRVLPLFQEDEEFGWFGKHLCDGIMAMMQGLDQIIMDTDLNPGWTSIADPATTPDAWIYWTAQLLGVVLPPGLTTEEQREYITLHPSQSRGSLIAMARKLEVTLTGQKVVHILERPEGHAYRIQFTTVLGETPNEAESLRALLSEKPGGLKLFYATEPSGSPLWNEATKAWDAVAAGVHWGSVTEGEV